MKRYLLFTYPEFYPSGGLNDYRDSSDSLEAIKEIAILCGDPRGNILDCQLGTVMHYSIEKTLKWENAEVERLS